MMVLHFSDRFKKVVKEIGTGIWFDIRKWIPSLDGIKIGPEIYMNTSNELPQQAAGN